MRLKVRLKTNISSCLVVFATLNSLLILIAYAYLHASSSKVKNSVKDDGSSRSLRPGSDSRVNDVSLHLLDSVNPDGSTDPCPCKTDFVQVIRALKLILV